MEYPGYPARLGWEELVDSVLGGADVELEAMEAMGVMEVAVRVVQLALQLREQSP